jgi:hypothetical protein
VFDRSANRYFVIIVAAVVFYTQDYVRVYYIYLFVRSHHVIKISLSFSLFFTLSIYFSLFHSLPFSLFPSVLNHHLNIIKIERDVASPYGYRLLGVRDHRNITPSSQKNLTTRQLSHRRNECRNKAEMKQQPLDCERVVAYRILSSVWWKHWNKRSNDDCQVRINDESWSLTFE